MSKEEIYAKLKAEHESEIKDNMMYCTLSKEAEMNEMFEVSGILRDIAHEEKTHAKLLKQILDMEV